MWTEHWRKEFARNSPSGDRFVKTEGTLLAIDNKIELMLAEPTEVLLHKTDVWRLAAAFGSFFDGAKLGFVAIDVFF